MVLVRQKVKKVFSNYMPIVSQKLNTLAVATKIRWL